MKQSPLLATAIILACTAPAAYAQDDVDTVVTSTPTASPLTFSGHVEAYYGYDLNHPDNHTRPSFVYAHSRHHEVNINLAFLKGAYANDKIRGNLALAVGTYMNANYAAEPGVLKNILEANVGVKLSKTRDLWLDAGVFGSHIGFESAHTPSCWTLTRSMAADNSPYFETGAKLTYNTANGKWLFSGLVLNGWQRIQRVDGNNTLGGGTQITWKPTSKVAINYSTFFGNDKPDSNHQTRIFHDVYATLQPTKKFGIILGFDYGMEQKVKGSSDYNNWYTPVLILRFLPTDNSAIAARAEYYSDENGVIIASGTPNGFKTMAYSLGFDRTVSTNLLWRIEGKYYNSEDKIFTDADAQPQDNDLVFTTSLSINF